MLCTRLGRLKGLGALGLALILGNTLAQGDLGSTVWLAQWVAQGFILAEVLRRSWDLNRTLGSAVLIALALQVSMLGVWAMQREEAPWSLLTQSMEAALRQALEHYGQGAMTEQEMGRIRQAIPGVSRMAVVFLPGVFASTNLLLQWWTLLVCRRFPVIRAGLRPGPQRLDEWGMPYHWVWLTILAGTLLLLPVEMAGAVGINVLIFMSSVHFLQGIAVISNFFRQKQVPPLLRGIVYALIFVQQILLLAVAAIGLFDLWFDFRRRWAGPALRA